MVRLKDIAEQVGVSIGTVSRVLNEDSSLSVSTKVRHEIIQTAQQMGYEKSSKGKHKRMPKLAVLQWYTPIEELNDQYYYAIRQGVEKRAQQLQFQVLSFFHQIDYPELDDCIGLIAIGKFNQEQIHHFRKQFAKPICFVDCDTLGQGYDCVIADIETSMEQLVDQLLLKHKRIGMISGQECYTDGSSLGEDSRTKYFHARLSQRHALDRLIERTGSFSVESGYRLMKEIITQEKELPTVLFAANDSIAIGSLKALKELNIQVPQQLEVIGFNDLVTTQYTEPSLSTIQVYTEQMGEEAVNLLLQRVAFSEQGPRKWVLPTRFIQRNSSLS